MKQVKTFCQAYNDGAEINMWLAENTEITDVSITVTPIIIYHENCEMSVRDQYTLTTILYTVANKLYPDKSKERDNEEHVW